MQLPDDNIILLTSKVEKATYIFAKGVGRAEMEGVKPWLWGVVKPL